MKHIDWHFNIQSLISSYNIYKEITPDNTKMYVPQTTHAQVTEENNNISTSIFKILLKRVFKVKNHSYLSDSYLTLRADSSASESG